MARNPYSEYVQNHMHGLTRTERQLLMKLCGFMVGENAKQCINASLETMETWLFAERTTIRRAIKSLTEKQLIMCKRDPGKPNRIYFGMMFWECFDNKIDAQFKKQPTAKCRDSGSKMPWGSRQNATQHRREEKTESVSSNYKSNFPSIHYASLNLIAMPKNLPAFDVFPSGGVL